MFETLSHLSLQQYWWFIVALLGGLFVFMMFVQGGQTLLNTLAKNESEKNDGIEQIDIDEIAKDVKKAITTDVNEKNVTTPPIVETENEPTQPTEFEEDDGGYLEELADLSKAIEKENGNKK